MLINSLGLKNFKCFEELDVKFAPITLLTGANSSGKSSLINAILAVLQTEQFPYFLSPNGQYANLGSYHEMAKRNSKEEVFEINISFNKTYEINIKSVWMAANNDLPFIVSLYFKDTWLELSYRLEDEVHRVDFKLKFNRFFHETPEEIQKRLSETDGIVNFTLEHHDTSSVEVSNLLFKYDLHPVDVIYKVEKITGNDISEYFRDLKYNGKFDFNYIGSFRLPPSRTYYRQSKPDFKLEVSGEGYVDQIIDWEESESDEYQSLISITSQLGLFQDVKSAKFKSGRFELNVKTHKKSKHVALNDVGFGISQFLPIIVADLQLSNESCLAVSQPEIHLHPKVQAQFGNYLVNQIKHTQKQYIIETHSEYLINRIRLLLVTGELKPEDVCVLYFENDGIKSTVHPIEFTTKGAVKGAPQGFFDTYEMDVMDIAMHAIG
ncbi:DUF3696 domain-containing protein [Spirosoma sp. 48-14]|uniref:DUF3696 domain-containing protein n=2 Tax=unclassified Spirosoma TaxID=2621999 RepID=UPI000961CE2E|nr:DUF3696 domain-containing protein [Spirosoma sp. 48-14]OJW78405.1 MAG: hypothetical protein BGO59_30865 [Spirosoma sp. 48-14]